MAWNDSVSESKTSVHQVEPGIIALVRAADDQDATIPGDGHCIVLVLRIR